MKKYLLYTLILFVIAPPCYAPDASAAAWELKKKLLKERNVPENRAFLDMIAFAEGTYYARAQGYKMRYPTGTTFASFDAHPALVICARSRNKQLCSTAAGRYMFLESTWNKAAPRLELADFSPLNQDLAALLLIYERHALDDIKKGDLKNAISKVKTIWSSLPGAPYRQPIIRYDALRNMFDKRTHHYRKYLKGKEWA